jgi:hypothetical protein
VSRQYVRVVRDTNNKEHKLKVVLKGNVCVVKRAVSSSTTRQKYLTIQTSAVDGLSDYWKINNIQRQNHERVRVEHVQGLYFEGPTGNGISVDHCESRMIILDSR